MFCTGFLISSQLARNLNRHWTKVQIFPVENPKKASWVYSTKWKRDIRRPNWAKASETMFKILMRWMVLKEICIALCLRSLKTTADASCKYVSTIVIKAQREDLEGSTVALRLILQAIGHLSLIFPSPVPFWPGQFELCLPGTTSCSLQGPQEGCIMIADRVQPWKSMTYILT